MKVLFDNNIPRRLRRSLKGHEVHTAREKDWATLRNGDLLRAAEDAGYDVMVTADQDLSYQQNLSGRRLALVVPNTNNWNILQHNSAPIVSAVEASSPGSFQFVAVDWVPEQISIRSHNTLETRTTDRALCPRAPFIAASSR